MNDGILAAGLRLLRGNTRVLKEVALIFRVERWFSST